MQTNLKVIMAYRGIGVTQLSDISGVSSITIYNLIAGKHSPQGRTLEKISKALGVEMSDFYKADLVNLGGK